MPLTRRQRKNKTKTRLSSGPSKVTKTNPARPNSSTQGAKLPEDPKKTGSVHQYSIDRYGISIIGAYARIDQVGDIYPLSPSITNAAKKLYFMTEMAGLYPKLSCTETWNALVCACITFAVRSGPNRTTAYDKTLPTIMNVDTLILEGVLEKIHDTIISLQGTRPHYSKAVNKSIICLPASFEVEGLIIPVFDAQYVPSRRPVAPIRKPAAPISTYYRPEDFPVQLRIPAVENERALRGLEPSQRHPEVGNRFRESISSGSRSYLAATYPVYADEFEGVAKSTSRASKYLPWPHPVYADEFEDVSQSVYWDY
jgi:hypothetical protein